MSAETLSALYPPFEKHNVPHTYVADEMRVSGVRDEGPGIQVFPAIPEIADTALVSGGFSEPVFEQLAAATPASASIQGGPRYQNFKWYDIGTKKIKFISQAVQATYSLGAISSKALNLISLSQNWNSHIWDDKWYWHSLPMQSDYYLLLMFHTSPGPALYGWVAIRNVPGGWNVMFTDGQIRNPGNGDQVKRRYIVNGYTVDFDVYNPPNSGPWTGNDIWVSFGF